MLILLCCSDTSSERLWLGARLSISFRMLNGPPVFRTSSLNYQVRILHDPPLP